MLCCHLSVELVAEWEEGENHSQDISGCLNAQIHLQKDKKKIHVRIRIEGVLSAEIEQIHNSVFVSVRRDGASSSDQFSHFYYQLSLLTWTPRWGRKKELIRVRRIITH